MRAGLITGAVLLLASLTSIDVFAGPREWPDNAVDHPLVSNPGLFQIQLAYSESRTQQSFDRDGTLGDTEFGQPTFVRGLTLRAAYGLFRGFEVSGTVPFVINREVEVVAGQATGNGPGRVRLEAKYQAPFIRQLFAAASAGLLLPTTDASLRPDPTLPESTPLNDSLGLDIEFSVKRSFEIASAQGAVGYRHTFANQTDIDNQRAPAPGWYAEVGGTVQAARVFPSMTVRFDRAGRTEVGGETVPDSDGWILELQPELGFHVHPNLDVMVRFEGAIAGKNAPREGAFSVGMIGRF